MILGVVGRGDESMKDPYVARDNNVSGRGRSEAYSQENVQSTGSATTPWDPSRTYKYVTTSATQALEEMGLKSIGELYQQITPKGRAFLDEVYAILHSMSGRGRISSWEERLDKLNKMFWRYYNESKLDSRTHKFYAHFLYNIVRNNKYLAKKLKADEGLMRLYNPKQVYDALSSRRSDLTTKKTKKLEANGSGVNISASAEAGTDQTSESKGFEQYSQELDKFSKKAERLGELDSKFIKNAVELLSKMEGVTDSNKIEEILWELGNIYAAENRITKKGKSMFSNLLKVLEKYHPVIREIMQNEGDKGGAEKQIYNIMNSHFPEVLAYQMENKGGINGLVHRVMEHASSALSSAYGKIRGYLTREKEGDEKHKEKEGYKGIKRALLALSLSTGILLAPSVIKTLFTHTSANGESQKSKYVEVRKPSEDEKRVKEEVKRYINEGSSSVHDPYNSQFALSDLYSRSMTNQGNKGGYSDKILLEGLNGGSHSEHASRKEEVISRQNTQAKHTYKHNEKGDRLTKVITKVNRIYRNVKNVFKKAKEEAQEVVKKKHELIYKWGGWTVRSVKEVKEKYHADAIRIFERTIKDPIKHIYRQLVILQALKDGKWIDVDELNLQSKYEDSENQLSTHHPQPNQQNNGFTVFHPFTYKIQTTASTTH